MTTMLWVMLFAATKVYRCETAEEIVFQQAPCAMADEPVELRPESSFGEQAAARAEPKATKAAPPRKRVVRGKPPGPKRDTACETARSKRDVAYAERGNTMSFDERRKLQDQLDAACGLR